MSDLTLLPLTAQTITAGGRRWQIDAVHDDGAIIDLSETHDVFPYGLKVWESAVVMADYLGAEGAALNGVSVLELGAGIGLPGMAAAKAGALVTATDHNQIALDLGARNAAANGVPQMTWTMVDWYAWDLPGRFQIIAGADVLYDNATYPAILKILEVSLAAGGRVVFTDPMREQTLDFIEMLRAAGWQVEVSERATNEIYPRLSETMIKVRTILARRAD
ncbi:MAG: methyltransferase [Hyphomicrobiaceae bacterium]|nr:methyltransferase [Hyphomicrobiaceae bacterium]